MIYGTSVSCIHFQTPESPFGQKRKPLLGSSRWIGEGSLFTRNQSLVCGLDNRTELLEGVKV
jgi:hypothetical protein